MGYDIIALQIKKRSKIMENTKSNLRVIRSVLNDIEYQLSKPEVDRNTVVDLLDQQQILDNISTEKLDSFFALQEQVWNTGHRQAEALLDRIDQHHRYLPHIFK